MSKGTVIVNLERDWFAPDGSLYEVRHNPHEFPAEWADKPERAEDESADDFKARARRQPFNVLPTTAQIVEGGRTVEVYRNTADNTGVLTAETVEEGVKSVGNTVDEDSKGPTDHNEAHQSSTVAAAAKAAKDSAAQIGGKPRDSNPPGGQPGAKT